MYYKKLVDSAKLINMRQANVVAKVGDVNESGNGIMDKGNEGYASYNAYQKEHPEKYRAASKKYYDQNKEKVLRKKILRNLNNGKVLQPTAATIQKYNLVYDIETNKWQ